MIVTIGTSTVQRYICTKMVFEKYTHSKFTTLNKIKCSLYARKLHVKHKLGRGLFQQFSHMQMPSLTLSILLSTARRGLEAERGRDLSVSVSFICSCTMLVLRVLDNPRLHDGTVSSVVLEFERLVEIRVVFYTTKQSQKKKHAWLNECSPSKKAKREYTCKV